MTTTRDEKSFNPIEAVNQAIDCLLKNNLLPEYDQYVKPLTLKAVKERITALKQLIPELEECIEKTQKSLYYDGVGNYIFTKSGIKIYFPSGAHEKQKTISSNYKAQHKAATLLLEKLNQQQEDILDRARDIQTYASTLLISKLSRLISKDSPEITDAKLASGLTPTDVTEIQEEMIGETLRDHLELTKLNAALVQSNKELVETVAQERAQHEKVISELRSQLQRQQDRHDEHIADLTGHMTALQAHVAQLQLKETPEAKLVTHETVATDAPAAPTKSSWRDQLFGRTPLRSTGMAAATPVSTLQKK